MKSLLFSVSALPLVFALGGCGGASSQVVTARTDRAVFALSGGQNATLTIQTQRNLVGGTLSVPTSDATTTSTVGALSFSLPRGNYGFNGILASDSTFRATGNVPSVAPFVLTGQLGTGASSGSFVLEINGQRVSGSLVRG